MDGKEEAAVVQLLHTESGPVAVIYPTHAIDAVIEGLKKAKQDSNNDKSDIFVPSSDADVEQAKQFHDQITEGKQ